MIKNILHSDSGIFRFDGGDVFWCHPANSVSDVVCKSGIEEKEEFIVGVIPNELFGGIVDAIVLNYILSFFNHIED